ncbi:hypothetical protein BO94DRAFT_305699 [Aspergillus sclerotioniger CBS 115572]|uniref:Uncharacterized protein n=1 Tax=Aspergillus sclerotioniger CBS 115572 TaxID=1450535 RepID=A0A317V162_9EURO|nr:hypothetical protein BO94DRAFT_305699 [Aspergillus sclerotioniger CBS 115572]PWY68013.1 hypothetical protein BO94DRAFT_305699 [Aspergillus sclerotioniger CBS 115572]
MDPVSDTAVDLGHLLENGPGHLSPPSLGSSGKPPPKANEVSCRNDSRWLEQATASWEQEHQFNKAVRPDRLHSSYLHNSHRRRIRLSSKGRPEFPARHSRTAIIQYATILKVMVLKVAMLGNHSQAPVVYITCCEPAPILTRLDSESGPYYIRSTHLMMAV